MTTRPEPSLGTADPQGHASPPPSPDFLPASPKRGPGVRRMNKRPMAIAFALLGIAAAGLGYSFIDRVESTKPTAASGGKVEDGKAAPVEKNALFAGVMPFGSVPDKTAKPAPPPAPPPAAPGLQLAAPANTAASATPSREGLSHGASPQLKTSDRPAEDPIALQLRQMALEKYKKSMQLRDAAAQAGFEVGGGNGEAGSAAQSAAQAVAMARPGGGLASTGAPATGTPAGFGIGGGAGGMPGSGGSGDQNRQAEKAAFINAAGSSSDYLGTTRTAPLGQYEVKAGTVIPSILISGINSDLPGQMIAQVQETVYSHVDAYMPLIPKGARIIGRYDSSVAMGQERVLVAWNRVIYPDGTSLNIGSMGGADVEGYSGFADEVDNHYLRLFGHAAFLSIFSAGVQLSQPQQKGESNGYSSQQIIAGSMGQQLGQLGMEMTRRNMNIQPTLKIRPGYEFNIVVSKDIVLPPWDAKR